MYTQLYVLCLSVLTETFPIACVLMRLFFALFLFFLSHYVFASVISCKSVDIYTVLQRSLPAANLCRYFNSSCPIPIHFLRLLLSGYVIKIV